MPVGSRGNYMKSGQGQGWFKIQGLPKKLTEFWKLKDKIFNDNIRLHHHHHCVIAILIMLLCVQLYYIRNLVLSPIVVVLS
jgi:hypothetical protein